MSVKHKAGALAVSCIDFRFQEMIAEDLAARGLNGHVDRITIAGATKNFESVKSNVDVSLKLHDPDQALIYEHEDCGAYDENNSVETHRANAQKLTAYLKEIKPEIKVTTLMATFKGIEDF